MNSLNVGAIIFLERPKRRGSDMHHLIVKRVALALIVLLIVAVVVFAMIVTP
jgi:hypothetical protein